MGELGTDSETRKGKLRREAQGKGEGGRVKARPAKVGKGTERGRDKGIRGELGPDRGDHIREFEKES